MTQTYTIETIMKHKSLEASHRILFLYCCLCGNVDVFNCSTGKHGKQEKDRKRNSPCWRIGSLRSTSYNTSTARRSCRAETADGGKAAMTKCFCLSTTRRAPWLNAIKSPSDGRIHHSVGESVCVSVFFLRHTPIIPPWPADWRKPDDSSSLCHSLASRFASVLPARWGRRWARVTCVCRPDTVASDPLCPGAARTEDEMSASQAVAVMKAGSYTGCW